MKTTRYSNYLVAGISLAGILIVMTVTAGSAFARPHRESAVRQTVQHHGKVVVSLPKNHRTVSVGRTRYFYQHGTFYRKAPAGYVVVNAPSGAVVFGLPVGYRTAVFGGMTYFTYGGVYYQRVPSGYRVVSTPPAMVATGSASCVCPTSRHGQLDRRDRRAAECSIRAGLNQAVVGQVIRGTRLVIQGSSAGWWYVQLPGGESGWVMAAFTTPAQQPANG